MPRSGDRWSRQARGGMCGLPDASERSRPRFFLPFRRGGDLLDSFAESIHPRIGTFPGIGQQFWIKWANHLPHVFQFEHSRAFRNEQANAKLNRRDIFDEGLPLQHVEQIEIAFQSRPRGKRHKRRVQCHAEPAKSLDDVQEILARVTLIEKFQNRIINGFHRADNKEASRIAKRGEMLLVFAQVLDLDSHVVGEFGKFTMEFLDEFHSMTDAVEKVRIPKRDVLRAGTGLAANVFHDNFAAHNSKDALVHRHDWTMPAKMFASAAGFRRTYDAVSITGHYQVGILFDGWQTSAIRYFKLQAVHRNQRFCLWSYSVRLRGQAFRKMDKAIFEFTAKNRGDSQRPQVVHVHRRIETVAAQVRVRIQFAQGRKQLRGQAGGCVHRQINGDQLGITNRGLVERLPRQVERHDLMAALPQPSCRRGQTKWLPAQLVGRNEKDVHAANSIAARHLDSISVMIKGCVA